MLMKMLFDKVKVFEKKKKLYLHKHHELHLKVYIFYQIELVDDRFEAKRLC